MLLLTVFLGNPGGEYARSRHNAGRLLAERLSFYDDLVWKKKFRGRFAQAALNNCHFLIPETYMNLSGLSVQAVAEFHKIQPKEIIAVHDEVELPLGTLSLKFAGGMGGHNGLRSIKDTLGTAEFWRLRIGVGRPLGSMPGRHDGRQDGKDGEIARWVLSDFNPDEMNLLEEVFKTGTSLLTLALTEEPETLLPEWKKKAITL
ncbi:MAG: aminoacyl-tRNA hydrolase [Treponema sp.]|jgi:PTH1 family peptidyl-tRNA hydrolase|nr:aminoacyl-tRNA hydrolase [Treponema sp.]